METAEILKALKSGRLSPSALHDIAFTLKASFINNPDKNSQLIKEIEQINKPIRQQVDDAIKELDV